MKTIHVHLMVVALLAAMQACGQSDQKKMNANNEHWKKVLTPEQYEVTCNEGTEPAFTGKYWDHKGDGIYTCVRCSTPLFDSKTKYDSGSGWPSYYQPVEKTNITEKRDTKFGMVRTEVRCSKCDAHLGHLFPDGPRPTGMRYCINSASLNFEERK